MAQYLWISNIHKYAELGDLEKVNDLIKNGVSVDSRDHYFRRTPLHWAAERGHYAVAELLISSRCDLNLEDLHGGTPVLRAANFGEKDVVDLLLQHGARVNCVDNNRYSLLSLASGNGWGTVVQRIIENGEADLNAATKSGETSLMRAARCGHRDIVALLIQAGADVHRGSASNWNVLHWATYDGHIQVVQLLLEMTDLDINLQDGDGWTPLHIACAGGHREVLACLLAAGANTTIKNSHNETPLSAGIKRGKLFIEDIRLFLQHKAFLGECEYEQISQNTNLKVEILQNVDICAQSIVNKYHHKSLPSLYSNSYFARKLPSINKFKLKYCHIDDVKNFVKCDIQTNTFCNVARLVPKVLTIMCVESMLAACQARKRSASSDFSDSGSPFKKPYCHNLFM